MRPHDTPSSWRSGRWPSMVKGVEPWVRRICLGNEDGAGIVRGEPHHQWQDQPRGRLVGGFRQVGEEGLQEEVPWEEHQGELRGGSPWGDYQEELHGGSLGYGWRGTSPRRARSLRRSPVRWSGVPRARLRRSRSLSRSRGERRVRLESPVFVRVTQPGRSPRRRTVPQKRLRQDSADVRRVRVRMEEVRRQSEVMREGGKSTLEEVRVVVHE